MAEYKIKVGKVQVVFFQGNRRVQIALGTVLVLTAAALGMLGSVQKQMLGKTEDLRSRAAQIAYENQVLSNSIDELGTTKGIERVAQEELGMAYKDTIRIEAQVK